VDSRRTEEIQILAFEMAALRKVLGIHIMDIMSNENNNLAFNLTD